VSLCSTYCWIFRKASCLIKFSNIRFSCLVERIRELETQWAEESSVRQSLEQRLFDISSVLDETDYDLVPGRLRESLLLRRSRCAPSGDASCSPEGVELRPSDEAASSTSMLNSPVNVTQLSNNDEYSGRYGTRLTRFRSAFLSYGPCSGVISQVRI
jgi:hypothetical protein